MPHLALDHTRPLVRGQDLPYSDGIPTESDWHVSAMMLLISILRHYFRHPGNVYVGGNMFVYFDPNQVKTRNFRGPDLFVVKGVKDLYQRNSWVVWEEDGLTPDFVLELASESTARFDRTDKKAIYEAQLKTPDYVIYDPARSELRAWRLIGRHYRPITPNAQGRVWSEELGLWVGVGEYAFQGEARVKTPRLDDRDGSLLPTPEEREAARADREAAARRALEEELAAVRAKLQAIEGGSRPI